MDPQKVSDGTGTPVANGLSLPQSLTMLEALIKKLDNVNYFEITEINPMLDTQGNKMGEAANNILNVVLDAFEHN